MKREEISVLAQLLTAIKDTLEKLEEYQEDKNAEGVASAKREILNFQKKMAEML